jgi:catechol 2,3-dioxygenase-like lactoylglutathione lyase family enzyme
VSESVKNISAISLFVEDLAEAKSFYRDVFDVEVVFEDESSACVKFDNLLINLLQVSEAQALVDPGLVAGPEAGSRFQLSIWVENVDAVCADLEKRGVKLLNGPINRDWGMRTANFVDPAGNSWEVAQQMAQG